MSTETKVLIGVLAATVLIIVGGAFLVGGRQAAPEAAVVDPARLVGENDPVLGPADAKVTVVEFGDFQCPACGSLHPQLKQVKQDFAGQSVRFVFRHFPLPQHPFAQLAAEASVEAQRQGKFWEYHDLLYENQGALERANLEEYAQRLDLDLDAFRKALDERTHKAAVDEDEREARALRLGGTPTIFINGVQYTGRYSAEELKKAIQDRL